MKKNKEYFKSIAIVMITQAFVYFAIKTLQHNFNLLNSIMTFPTIKWFVYIYDAWYPTIILLAFLIYKKDKELYKELLFSLILGALLSHITFLIYPTMITRPEIKVNNLTDLVLFITYKTDTPAVNCLPSVHCLFCFITSYYILKSNTKTKYKVPIIVFLFLIVLSTLFIKQHVIEDVILALIYTVIVILLVPKIKDKLKKILAFIF